MSAVLMEAYLMVMDFGALGLIMVTALMDAEFANLCILSMSTAQSEVSKALFTCLFGSCWLKCCCRMHKQHYITAVCVLCRGQLVFQQAATAAGAAS